MISLLQGRRLVIVHNPHSSHASDVHRDVFERLDAAGYQYTTLEVKQASLEDNIARLAPLIRPRDLILSAAGDGSAHALAQAVIAANKPDVMVGFLAFGNFNDLPHTFSPGKNLRDPIAFLNQARPEVLYPLHISVNGSSLRRALLYVTLGWTAQAASRFDRPEFRRFVHKKRVNIIGTLWQLGLYYFRSRRHSYLPSFTYLQKEYAHQTDILCVNGPRMARLFGTGVRYYRESVFLFKTLSVTWLLPNIPFLVRGVFGHMSGKAVESVSVGFQNPSSFLLQCDGEVVQLSDISQLVIEKSTQSISVLTTRK